MAKTNNRRSIYYKHNLTRKEKLYLDSLKNNKDIVIRVVDKDSGVVLLDYKSYNAEALNILSNSVYYERVTEN